LHARWRVLARLVATARAQSSVLFTNLSRRASNMRTFPSEIIKTHHIRFSQNDCRPQFLSAAACCS
jgi:hypothetical protein